MTSWQVQPEAQNRRAMPMSVQLLKYPIPAAGPGVSGVSVGERQAVHAALMLG